MRGKGQYTRARGLYQMANPYNQAVRARVKGAIDEAHAAAAIGHAGLKGRIREILIGSVFRPLLPADLGIGTGQILDFYQQRQSPEQDIVLYDRSILPPILYADQTGIFPVESVLYTIEVKSRLTAEELRSAHNAAKYLAGFTYLPGRFDDAGHRKHHHIEKVRSVLVALDTDLAVGGKSELERYAEIRGDDAPFLRAICVVGRGYWYHTRGDVWPKCPDTYEGAELVGLLGGVMNTYRWVSLSRGYPPLGNYVIDSDSG